MYYFTVYYFFMYFVSHARTEEHEHVASYDEAQVWRTKLRDDEDVQAIKKLMQDQDISIWNLEYDKADFLIKGDDKVKVNRYLNARQLNHSVLILDVQRKLDFLRTEPAMWNEETLKIGHRLNWKEYPTLGVIDEYLHYLTENFPSICNTTTIGYTAENRSIKVVKISNGNPNNMAIVITSGVHAREWSAITSTLYIIHNIVSKFDHLPGYMQTVDWLIIPVFNPDGYEYTHTHDRLWRKNRQKRNHDIGVDINRNFGIYWDILGITEKNPRSDAYSGPYPFSEAESKALRDMVLSLNKKPQAMVDFHSYGQMILYPWSAKPDPTPDSRILWSTATSISGAIFNATGKNYKYGATYHQIYPATGVVIDWMYSAGVTLSFGIELGDEGDHGFLMPSENIEPTGIEALAAVKGLVREFNPESLNKKGVYRSWF